MSYKKQIASLLGYAIRKRITIADNMSEVFLSDGCLLKAIRDGFERDYRDRLLRLESQKKRQGQSESVTHHKLRGFGDLMRMVLRIQAQTCRYLCGIDLNAGCGVNDLIGEPGSPVQFLRALLDRVIGFVGKEPNGQRIDAMRAFRLYVCERAVEYGRDSLIRLLRELLEVSHQYPSPYRPNERSKVTCLWGDNKDAIDWIVGDLRDSVGDEGLSRIAGCMFVDPNGPSRKSTSIQGLTYLLNSLPRLDIIINWNTGSVGRNKGGLNGPNMKKNLPTWIESVRNGTAALSVLDLINLLPKDHWWVRDPLKGFNTYTMLYGSNCPDHLIMSLNTELLGHRFFLVKTKSKHNTSQGRRILNGSNS